MNYNIYLKYKLIVITNSTIIYIFNYYNTHYNNVYYLYIILYTR